MKERLLKTILPFLATIIFFTSESHAYTVTNLTATYKNGQVFLTWQNPDAINLEYKVYRSSTVIDETSDLASCTYLGNVRDHSGENLRKTKLKNDHYYFVIDPTQGALDKSKGLYVTTCSDEQSWYYAVTIENLTGNTEDQTIISNENSLTTPVEESVAPTQPILQTTYADGDWTVSEYVIWGNNTNTIYQPAFNNCGSYGYNFTFFSRGATKLPLYIYFRNTDPFSTVYGDYTNGRHVLLMDDWMPNGKSTDWFGYHEDYDMYAVHNDVHTTGIIKSYTQARIKYTLDWILANMPIDGDRVYASGSSHNGLGAALTAELNPDKLAAIWISVAPILVKAVTGTDWEELWCDASKNLSTDIIDPLTGAGYKIFDVLDMRHMYQVTYGSGIPYIAGVHGKEDFTVGWVEQKHWYDSVNYSHQGGAWFWDQRQHDGSGKQFDDDEIKIDFSRFSAHTSYPAFANCSINQDPGNGNRNSGAPYGAINGYLDWVDSSVVDEHCRYRVKCFIKDMTVAGELQPQYDSCFADVAIRRTQNFHPVEGDKIRWWVVNNAGTVLQDGYSTYNGVDLLSISGAKILRSGSYIIFKIKNCDDQQLRNEEASTSQDVFDKLIASSDNDDDASYADQSNLTNSSEKSAEQFARQIEEASGKEKVTEYPAVQFYRRGTGYVVNTTLDKITDVLFQMTDMTGRTIIFKRIHMVDGQNEFNLDAYRGNYLFTLYAPDFTYKKKISF